MNSWAGCPNSLGRRPFLLSERRPLDVYDLGLVPFEEALELQKALHQERAQGLRGDLLLLLEHPHVLTIGTGGRAENILLDAENLKATGVPVYRINRGGDVTYHGPGQLVGYPILDLRLLGRDLHLYLRSLEEVFIRLLSELALEGRCVPGRTGVWVGEEKVLALGIGVRRWVSMHGFALNVEPDLGYFELINPCGIRDAGVTSLKVLLGETPPMEELKEALLRHFGDVFSFEPRAREAQSLRGVVSGLGRG